MEMEKFSHLQPRVEVLDVIDRLRLKGLHHYVNIPQIVVCGDQSSGKSSVLEALSRIRFPTKDNLCTRFATEVILRRTSDVRTEVSIIPSKTRSEVERTQLARFSYPDLSLDDVPSVIESAKREMGLDTDARAFSGDILRIESCGPEQPQLTLVDLPGLIHSENKMQSTSDVKLVMNLVRDYISNTRSVILAVVSAKNDYANQVVTKLAREVDGEGRRTLGIITKPDTLYAGSDSEEAFVDLAKNETVSFRLGWHVVKNRDWAQRDTSVDDRDSSEEHFFAKGVWSKLPRANLGIATLKARLGTVLLNQITAELPHLVRDVEASIKDCRDRLEKLGMARDTPHEQRTYLLHVSERFGSLVKAATNGVYMDIFFGDARSQEGYNKRLRAVVQRHLSEFEERMRDEGHEQDIAVDGSLRIDDPRFITRKEFLQSVRTLMRRTKGCELPGTFNPLLIGDLFYHQSQPWARLARECRNGMLGSISVFLSLVMSATVSEETREELNRHVFVPATERIVAQLDEKIAETLRPHQHGHPITYNHYFIEKIQAAREQHARSEAIKKLNVFFKRSESAAPAKIQSQTFDILHLAQALSRTAEPDMEIFACSEATDCMLAYYQVALKVFVDNFSTLAIEFCLMDKVSDIFTPKVVTAMSDQVIRDIAAESADTVQERDGLRVKLESLEHGLSSLHSLTRHQSAVHGVSNLDPREYIDREVDTRCVAIDAQVEEEAASRSGSDDAKEYNTDPKTSGSFWDTDVGEYGSPEPPLRDDSSWIGEAKKMKGRRIRG